MQESLGTKVRDLERQVQDTERQTNQISEEIQSLTKDNTDQEKSLKTKIIEISQKNMSLKESLKKDEEQFAKFKAILQGLILDFNSKNGQLEGLAQELKD